MPLPSDQLGFLLRVVLASLHETEDEQPNLPPPAGNGVGTATVKQPKMIPDPGDNFSNWDRYIMAILEVATGVQIIYALFREIVNRLPTILARNNIPRQV
uniref:Uncharacterized protein n=1 Tax=Oryza rufipogon TaxID=4529 RepID=A0A0E0NZH0_ORYRU